VSVERLLESEPWLVDALLALRVLERNSPDAPRIGDSAARRDDRVTLGQDPYLDFPASTISRSSRDAQGRLALFVRFLGLLGPQGALPLAVSEEAYGWSLSGDDAFPRFLDIFNNRFLQLFYRAWADARPIAQHERPDDDRFAAFVGSTFGIGSPVYRQLDSIDDMAKLGFAGLLGQRGASASRLKSLIEGLFGVRAEIDQFAGTRLPIEPQERSRLGIGFCALGKDTLLGATLFSVEDKFRVRILARDLDEYERFLPVGEHSPRLVDLVFFCCGDEFEWDVELSIDAAAVKPMTLGKSGRLGWTSWVAPNWSHAKGTRRADARFNAAERAARRRAAAPPPQ
jgi:type VI secretion system protein ImpH